MSRLLVLGAGPFQVSGIRKAMALGHEVITVDHTPNNVGHRWSAKQVHCSTTDANGILEVARALDVDGICTFASDVAVPTVAHASNHLHLSGIPEVAAQTMAFKHRFRHFQREHGLPHPRFVHGNSSDALGPPVGFSRPLVVKPVDTSGSRGVTLLSDPKPDALNKAFALAKTYSRSGTVCIEEFVPGTEVGGDAIVLDGRIAFIAITQKFLDGFVVTGHRVPADLPEPARQGVVAALEACCSALGNITTVINFDVIVNDRDTVVLEISPRTGGNGIPAVIAHATGIDPEVATIRLALGEAVDIDPRTPVRGVASWVFGSRCSGVLRQISTPQEVYGAMPELLDLHLTATVGQRVEPFSHGGNLLGYALFNCPSPEDYLPTVARIERALALELASP